MIAGGERMSVRALFLSESVASVMYNILKPKSGYIRSIIPLSLLLYMSDYLHVAKKRNYKKT